MDEFRNWSMSEEPDQAYKELTSVVQIAILTSLA